MSFSIRQARYFVATAKAGQVSRAAIELNISQSAVTAAIQQLEGVLGVALFDRRSDGVVLTQEGYRFLRHAEHILAAVEDALELGSDETAEAPRGKVRIGMSYTVAGYFAAPLLSRASRRFPDIEIEMIESERRTLEADLVAGRIDLALMLTSNLRDRAAISHETLIRSRRRLWLPAGHPLMKPATLALRDIVSEPYILLTVDEAVHAQRAYWKASGVQPNVVFKTSSVEAVRTMVASGMGLTVLSDMVFRPWSLDGRRLETRDLADAVPSMDVGVAWSAQGLLSNAVQTLRSFLVNSSSPPRRAGSDSMAGRQAPPPSLLNQGSG